VQGDIAFWATITVASMQSSCVSLKQLISLSEFKDVSQICMLCIAVLFKMAVIAFILLWPGVKGGAWIELSCPCWGT
jgi:hypothetical protein